MSESLDTGFSRAHIHWTDKMKLYLAREAFQNQAYKKTSINMSTKWGSVLLDLVNKRPNEFKDLQISNPLSLQTTFQREMERVLKITGTSREGANVSALSEENMEYYNLMIDMAKDKERESCLKKRKKEKKKLENKILNSIERQGLKVQGAIELNSSLYADQVSNSSLSRSSPTEGGGLNDTANTGSSESSDHGTESFRSKKSRNDPSLLKLNYIESLTEGILNDLRDSAQNSQEDQAVEKELKKAQLEAAQSKKRFYDLQIMHLEQQMKVNVNNNS